MWKYYIFSFIVCTVVEINCWSGDNTDVYRNLDYRSKRPKYYPMPSRKQYSRPTYSFSNKGPFSSSSYGYSINDIGLPTAKLRPYKVSRRPINEGLGDDDFNNLIKYLSHKDFDKIIKFAAEKEKYSDKYRYSDSNSEYEDFENNDLININYKEDSQKMYPDIPNVELQYNKYKHFDYRPNNMYAQTPINVNEEETQLSLLDEYIQREINVMSNKNIIFTDSSTMKEEELPKPLNLREEDYHASFTNNVPNIAKPETPYRLENFADLPLMNYENSKLERVNSYSVPHYSVISSSNQLARLPSPPPLPQSSSHLSSSILSLISAPEVEPAPPASVAKEQSDAHLKAIKIWTHKSRGTAYTLHDDGTLSLEQPSRPRHKYS